MDADLYVPGDGWLHRTDPRVKFLISIVMLALCLVWRNWAFILGILILEHVMLATDRVPAERIGWVWKILAVLIVFNRLHIYDLLPYIVVGLGMWVCFLMSGVHATIAGVLLALAIPARSQVKLDRAPGWFAARARRADDRYDPGEPDIVQKEYLSEVAEIGRVSRLSIPPITRLDHRLHIPVYFFILPLFAFSNASVVLTGMDLLSIVTNPVTIGVFCGLLFGKPLGIFLATWLTVKLKLSDLPQGVNWGHIGGVSVLGGVGFTMAIFVTNLAFVDPNMIAMAKAAILAASLIAGIAGFFILRAVTDEEDEEPVR